MALKALNLDLKYLPPEDALDQDEALALLDEAEKNAALCGAPYEAGIRKCTGAILACRAIAWDAADRLANLMTYQSAAVGDAAQQAYLKGGGGKPGEDARAQFVRGRTKEISAAVTGEFEKDGLATGKAAADAMTALISTINIERSKSAFTELGAKRDLAELISLDRLGEQIKNQANLAQLYDTYSALVEAKQDTDAERIEMASEKWLRELDSESTLQRTKRLTGGNTREAQLDDKAMKERTYVSALLRMFGEQRAKRVSPKLTLAAQIFTELLVEAFRRIVGLSVWDLSSTQFNASLMGQGRLPDPLECLEKWWVRHLPESRPAPSTALALLRRGGDAGPKGWTPLGRRGADGIRRRSPMNPVDNRVSNDRPVLAGSR